MKNQGFLRMLLGVMLVGCNGWAAELGMRAPPLTLSQWVKGQPWQSKEGSNITVVLFWSGALPDAKDLLVQVSALQQHYLAKGVMVTGVSEEPAGVYKPMADTLGSKLNFPLATDDHKKTWNSLMVPFSLGEEDVPHCFVIDRNGVLAWHGHPMGGLAGTLEELLSGKFDYAMARSLDLALQMVRRYFLAVSGPAAKPEAATIGQMVITNLSMYPGPLNDFAWRILADRGIRHRDRQLALEATTTALNMSQGTNAYILDTHARALFENGKISEAISTLQKAIAGTKDERQRIEMEASLNRYRRILQQRAAKTK